MAIQTIIKNTFIDLVDADTAVTSKRSSSLPRSWKLATPISVCDKRALPSDASTVDSEECWSVMDHEGSSSGFSSTESDTEHQEEQPLKRWSDAEDQEDEQPQKRWSDTEDQEEQPLKTVLCLSEAITAETKLKSTKLSSKARLFEPVLSLPMDMRLVLTAAHAALCGSPKIFNVQMTEGSLGGTTTIVGCYARSSLKVFELAKTLSIVKMAFLDAAEHSTNTYVLGYMNQPFTDAGQTSFSASIGSVNTIQETTTCWDTYQKGFCPRRSTCRWCHPHESDLAKVVVTLIEIDQ